MRVPAVLVVLMLSTPALAGTRHGFRQGRDAYDAHQWAEATAELQAALDEPSDLKKKERPEAAYLLGKAWVERMRDKSESREVREEAPIRAVEALVLARDLARKPWSAQAEAELADLTSSMIGVASVMLEQARGASSAMAQERALLLAWDYLEAVQQGDPTGFRGPLLLGYARWQARALPEAQLAWAEAVRRYEAHPQNGPDPEILGAFTSHASSLGLIEVLDPEDEDPEEALALCDQGIALAKRELGREGDDPARRQAWVDGRRQLEALRLDVLVRHEGTREQALEELKAMEAAEPSNAMVRVVHAGLLEATGDADGARALYDDALAIDPDYPSAHAGIGRLLVGRASLLMQQALDADEREAQALQTRGLALMNEARPHLEAVVAKDKTDLSALVALSQIAAMTGDMESMKRWKAAIEAVKPGQDW